MYCSLDETFLNFADLNLVCFEYFFLKRGTSLVTVCFLLWAVKPFSKMGSSLKKKNLLLCEQTLSFKRKGAKMKMAELLPLKVYHLPLISEPYISFVCAYMSSLTK